MQQQGETTTKEYCTSLKKKKKKLSGQRGLFGIPTPIFIPGSNMEKTGEKITLTAFVFSEDGGFLCAGSQR